MISKVKNNIIGNYIDKNFSPEEILEELKKIKLEGTITNLARFKKYVYINLELVWNKDENKWQRDNQINYLEFLGEEDDKEFQKYLTQATLNLSPNASETLLKDMKDILTNLKVITKDIARIATSIDALVGVINSKEDKK
ncbi:hypothetical protein P8V03_15965 [Clostridium sp. A1-XYC3]|uniref:Uncharacterized protein n=1 Tax=Clostridium tanneri TaxID=3037988 RepID=A0ABU4JWW1_9CLOT|nr:hypothetical protein [Clostridium sp. A1-XYC3]MDW8802644.1 hypothetical protein [Clostridium sp. A1-XYC3]